MLLILLLVLLLVLIFSLLFPLLLLVMVEFLFPFLRMEGDFEKKKECKDVFGEWRVLELFAAALGADNDRLDCDFTDDDLEWEVSDCLGLRWGVCALRETLLGSSID